jgi:hypothetical protein
MVRAPTPEDEDRRRLCRERKTLTVERVQHVNRIKGLLFSQGISGYEPLRRNRRQWLGELKTGDGRPLPPHLKSQIGRELDRLELLLGQIKAVEAERDAFPGDGDRRNARATGDVDRSERDRRGICRRCMVGGALPELRQPKAGRGSKTCSPAARSSVMWRQSMQTKAMAPSWQRAAASANVSTRKRVKEALSISPTRMANSRWRMRPEPHTWPSIGTLYGGSVNIRLTLSLPSSVE